MRSTVRRTFGALAVAVLSLGGLAVSAGPAAAADPTIPFTWNIDASTTLAKLGMTVDVPGGTFAGAVNLVTWDLTGDMALPPATTTMKLAGLPLAKATFVMAQAEPVTGHVDLGAMTVTATSSFNIKLPKLTLYGLPWINLVKPSCTTKTPVSVTMSGPVDLSALTGGGNPMTFSGTYTIPPFKDCGLLTPAITLVASGPGNTFTATASPA